MRTATSSAGNPARVGTLIAGVGCAGPPRPGAAGFTLLEILVVFAIASLILSLVPLAFSGSVDLVRSKGAARELVATLQQARSRAVARNQIVDVDFDAGSGRYTLSADGTVRVVSGGVRLILVELERMADDGNRGRIRFYPNGSSSGGQLRLDDGKRSFHVAVHWLLGRIDVNREQAS